MSDKQALYLGSSPSGPQHLVLSRANRHGLIAGATGTGKTVTLQVLAEQFAAAGTAVFAADVKGDLSGIAMAGSPQHPAHNALTKRASELGLSDYAYVDNPVVFWDLFGEQGHPIRTTVTEMGPLLLARLMGLNEIQEGVLTIAFRAADEQGLLLLNLEDLQALLAFCSRNASDLSSRYGNVTKASVGAIQRQLLQLQSQGGDKFFGEPALDIADLLRTDDQGRGIINLLAADRLMQSPRLYSSFLLWLLSELFEELPEVGDTPKPKLVFFFDEAHLLFDEAPAALREKIEQVVRLIRSKGVGVYFVTQNPADIPDEVAGQLGSRVQHALRVYTPKDQRAIKAAAETFRTNPDVDVAEAITQLHTGEALVSVLGEDGAPTPVQRTMIRPPQSRLGPLTQKERAVIRSLSPVEGKYDEEVDRESAFEILRSRGGGRRLLPPRPRSWRSSARRRGGARRRSVRETRRFTRRWRGRSAARSRGRWRTASPGSCCAACSGACSAAGERKSPPGWCRTGLSRSQGEIVYRRAGTVILTVSPFRPGKSVNIASIRFGTSTPASSVCERA